MTGSQRSVKKNRPRLATRAGWQRVARRATATLMPWSPRVLATRLRSQADMLGDHVGEGDEILDVGCGTGDLCQYLGELYGAKLTGLDIRDARTSPVDFRHFDGASIPFPDNAFDHVILSFVLHHSYAPATLVQECRRVARRGVIVFEDLPDSRFGRMLTWIHVGMFKLAYRLKSPQSDYRSALAWLSDNAANVVKTPLPHDWFDILYRVPRYLLVYRLSAE